MENSAERPTSGEGPVETPLHTQSRMCLSRFGGAQSAYCTLSYGHGGDHEADYGITLVACGATKDGGTPGDWCRLPLAHPGPHEGSMLDAPTTVLPTFENAAHAASHEALPGAEGLSATTAPLEQPRRAAWDFQAGSGTDYASAEEVEVLRRRLDAALRTMLAQNDIISGYNDRFLTLASRIDREHDQAEFLRADLESLRQHFGTLAALCAGLVCALIAVTVLVLT